MEYIIIAFGLLVTILWLIIGWRAMKAHEALAHQATRFNDRLHSETLVETKRDLTDQKKLYAKFLRENPNAGELSSKERHVKFRDWLEDHS